MRILSTILLRLAYLIPTLLGLIILTFFIAYYVPANPAGAAAGPFADAETLKRITEKYGFDKPIPVQLWRYLKRLARGDLGESFYTRRDVSDEIFKRLPATMELVLCALAFSILMGIPVGVVSAIRRNTAFDHLLRALTIAGIALATFWIAIELQLLFSYKIRLFPLTGRIAGPPPNHITGFYLLDAILTLNTKPFFDTLHHLVLPTFTLGIGPFATIVRFTRAGVLNVLNSDYVTYGRAMGLPPWLLISKYVLRNALTSTVSQIGLLFGGLLASGFVVEMIFNWPGIGTFAVQSILMFDYNAVLGVTLLTGVVYAVGNLATDILLMFIDPREVTR